jgi:hypothetical protein
MMPIIRTDSRAQMNIYYRRLDSEHITRISANADDKESTGMADNLSNALGMEIFISNESH